MPLPKCMSFIRLALPVFALLGAGAAAAQTPPPAPPPRIVSITPARATVGSYVTVKVANLPATLSQASERRKLVLYLNGFALSGVVPDVVDKDQLRFRLLRVKDNEDSEKAWSALLGKVKGTAALPVDVGIGLPDQGAFGQPDGVPPVKLALRAYTQGDIIAGLLGVGIALAAFIVLALRTTIIRDRTVAAVPERERPFSLARFQMAVWFFVILGSVMYLMMVMGELVMTQQALILLGIGAATQLGAAVVESSKPDAPATTALPKSTGFFSDLVTDENGVSLHRFQMLIWTLVLASMFVAGVYETLTMPVFDTTLLALIGLSGGTYVTFKAYENQPGADAAAAAKQKAEEEAAATAAAEAAAKLKAEEEAAATAAAEAAAKLKAEEEAAATAAAEAAAKLKAEEEAAAAEKEELVNLGTGTQIIDSPEKPLDS